MKRRRLVQVLSVLLCMSMLCSIPVYAVESKASEQIDRSNIVFSKNSNGDFSIYFSVQATGRMNVIGASSVEVQRYTTFGWLPEFTFTPDDTPELQAENKTRHSATLIYSPLYTGKSYRAVVTIYAEDAFGASSKQLTSKDVTS